MLSDGNIGVVFAHEGLTAALCARARLHILEARKLEKLSLLGARRLNLLLHSVVGMSLCVREGDLRWALGRVLDSADILALNVRSSRLAETIGHHNVDGGLRAQGATVRELIVREVHRAMPDLLLLQLDIDLSS